MPRYLDLANWARRDLFEFFRGFDKPYFNICTRVDVTDLLALLHLKPNLSVSLAYHYFALRVANEIEPFRYRLREDKVIVHDVIHGAAMVIVHQLFPRAELGPRGFGAEDRIWQVRTRKRPHSLTDFRRGT